MGEVWRAEDTLLGRAVAIKMVRQEYSDDATFRERFRNEARHAAVLTHPNVTQVFDFDEGGEGDDEPPYIVMEYVDGQPLSDVLADKGALSDRQTWSIIGQTAAALAAAHAIGVVHRNIKTGNILVCDDGRVKVTDFGIARAVDEASTTQTGFLLGTANYLAPELLRGQSATPASDMYALGVVAYECIAGRAPFTGELADVIDAQQREQVPPLPRKVAPALRDLVMALLAKDPAQRPSDAGHVAAQAQRRAGMSALSGARLVVPDAYPRESAAADSTAAQTGPDTQIFDDGFVPAHAGDLTEAPPSASYGAGADGAPTGPRRGLLIALGCLVVVALVAAAVLLTIRAVGGGSSSATPTHSSSPKKSAKPIAITSTAVFSPTGAGSDHPEELPLAVDSSKSSAWFTEHYASADFGSLKSGVG